MVSTPSTTADSCGRDINVMPLETVTLLYLATAHRIWIVSPAFAAWTAGGRSKKSVPGRFRASTTNVRCATAVAENRPTRQKTTLKSLPRSLFSESGGSRPQTRSDRVMLERAADEEVERVLPPLAQPVAQVDRADRRVD